MGSFGTTEIIIIAIIVLVLFGAKRPGPRWSNNKKGEVVLPNSWYENTESAG